MGDSLSRFQIVGNDFGRFQAGIFVARKAWQPLSSFDPQKYLLQG
jgi:hypothetical protein